VSDQQFAKWARGRILRVHAAVFRRYELKYSRWPYRLFRLIGSGWDDVEQAAVVDEAMRLGRCCVDTFTRGMRARFPSGEKLRSQEAKSTIRAAFDSQRLTSDFSERQNAEIQASRAARGPAREFEHFSRAMVVKQSRVVHLRNGGDNPLRPKQLKGSVLPCECKVMPFLVPLPPIQRDHNLFLTSNRGVCW